MDSIRLQNFRSIIDSGDIHLNNINFLLGKNSSGKSSFLRIFPLFKESVKNELRSPLMWFDDESYDFGDFKNSFCRNAEKNAPISFEFSWHTIQKKLSGKCETCSLYDRRPLGFMNNEDYQIRYSIKSFRDHAMIR